MLATTTNKPLILILIVLLNLVTFTSSAQQQISAETLKQLPPYPNEYQRWSYAERVQWLQQQLNESNTAAGRYQLQTELAFQHFGNYANAKVKQLCLANPAQQFDLDYRYICAVTAQVPYQENIRQLIQLHDEAIHAKNFNLATQALSTVAWKQSSQGDIASAFRSYELALSLAEQASPEALNDVMLNTAALYVMHGDKDYVQKGVQLQLAAINRLETLKQEIPAAVDYANEMIALTQHNVGVAYTLHLRDYAKAILWLSKIAPTNKELRRSALVFSALSAAELQQYEQARAWLAAAKSAPVSTEINTDYLDCYLQLVELKLQDKGELTLCRQLDPQTPLEVRQDIYKRMALLSNAEWRLLGLEKFHQLFLTTLEPQLKQSSTQAASHAELSRLQLESQLNSELLAKEQSLKQAEQEKRQSQTLLTAAGAVILLLVMLVITIQLRQNRKLARQYQSLSVLDGLTGLNNRRYFEQNIERELNFVRRSQQDGTGHNIAFYLFDIDHFKKINDNHGHDAGDEVLIEFSRRIKAAIRETDMLIRWGGEEFMLVARLEKNMDQHQIAERIRTVIAQQAFKVSAQTLLPVTCTIGVVVYPHCTDEVVNINWHSLVQLADAALYLGKKKQRNCWVSVDNILELSALDSLLQQDLELSQQNRQIILSSQFAAGQTPAA